MAHYQSSCVVISYEYRTRAHVLNYATPHTVTKKSKITFDETNNNTFFFLLQIPLKLNVHKQTLWSVIAHKYVKIHSVYFQECQNYSMP